MVTRHKLPLNYLMIRGDSCPIKMNIVIDDFFDDNLNGEKSEIFLFVLKLSSRKLKKT